MNRNDFKNISIRGRIAFAICCIEKSIVFFNYSFDDWEIVLKQLWTYTNIEFFDDWHYSIAEYLPESILEFDTYGDDFEYVSEEQFHKLYKLYSNSNSTIQELIKLIFNAGISEFYSRLENYGQRTLDNLKIIIDFMNLHEIPLPDINHFKPLVYDENKGWGREFNGIIKYSNIK